MEDPAAGILVQLVIEAAERVGALIKRQFKYLCCFSTNITNLKMEAENLQDTAADLQRKVDRARDDVRVISDEVKTLLQDTKNIKHESDEILKEVPNVGTSCLEFRARFSLSKRAKKKTDLLKELRDKCNKFDDDNISQPPPPVSMEEVPLEGTYELESRKQIEEHIMQTLRLGDVNMMGICGMGGLGKTTMAKRVMNRALKEHVFKEVVFATVGQPPVDKLKVQVDIGRSLGLSDHKDKTSEVIAAHKLRARLSGPERILLILDDVWERLVLEDLGIPSNHKGCTILSTSRNCDVLCAMNIRKVFGLQVLTKEDAWFLFRERAGMCVDDRKLNSIAKEVVNKCKGLPIALTTVGAALRDEMNVGIWKDALRQLRQCDPDIPELIANIYNPLKLSYDVLGPKQKYVFLLCCLYGEDVDIPLEHLIYYCMGLGIFEGGIRNVEEARNSMCSLTNMLKRRSLLLDSGRKDDYVRMHDVVRDVCIFIAKQEGYIGGNDCSWISLTQSFQFPTELEFSNLRLLLWNCDLTNEEFELDGFLEGVRDLHVLSIEYSNLLTSLPLTTQSLKNLKTLVLNRCWRLEVLSRVGELVNLEIFICRDCKSIKELPSEIKVLNRLKVLDLTGCHGLQRIDREIISSLVGLQELKMLGSFKKWEAEDSEERENVALRELEVLTNLRCLEIEIEDAALIAQNMRLSSKLEKYHIEIGYLYKFDSYPSNKKMGLVLEEESSIGDWIEMQLLRDTEYLVLEGNDANKIDFSKLENIRFLELSNCESMKKTVTLSSIVMDDCGGATLLSSIETLKLILLPKLEQIWDGQIPSNFFQNLKELRLYDLLALKQVWKDSSRGMDYLPQLEVLSIVRCEMMEQVFSWEQEDKNEEKSIQSPNSHHVPTKSLPKLKELELLRLPNLTSFYQGIQGIEFSQLMTLKITGCKKMKIMVSKGKGSSENSSKAQIQDVDWQPQEMSFGCLKQLTIDWNSFCGCKIDVSLFNGLEELTIQWYEGGMSFITPSIAENLFNLKQLCLKWCFEMVQVIEDDEEKLVSGGKKTLLFPKLHTLALWNLRKLVSFCEWKCDVELPSLREISIYGCPLIKNFTLGHLDTPNLERVQIDDKGVDLGVGKDLNGMLQRWEELVLNKESRCLE